jgi:hypothetical protein
MAKKAVTIKGSHPTVHELPRALRRPVGRPVVYELPKTFRRPVVRPGVHELPRALRLPGHRPGVNELPVESTIVAVLVGEMDAMRARLNNIENEILDLKLGRLPVGLPKPNELPAELEGV